MTRIAAALCALGLAGLAFGATPGEEFTTRGKDLLANKEARSDGERLHRLFDFSWEYNMKESPEFATAIGYPGQNDRWTDMSLEAIARREETDKLDLELIKSIDRAKLSGQDAISYDLYRRNAEFSVEGAQFPFEFLQLNQMGGVQQNVAQVISSTTFRTAKDYEDLIARLNGVSALIDQTIALLQKGLEQKMTPPQVTLRTCRNSPQPDRERSARAQWWRPFKAMSALVPTADRLGCVRQQRRRSRKKSRSVAKLHDFWWRISPGARTTLGAQAPNVTSSTPTPPGSRRHRADACAIHQIGLDEVNASAARGTK